MSHLIRAVVLVIGVVLFTPSTLCARGGKAADPKPADPKPAVPDAAEQAQRLGAQYFRDAVAYVANGHDVVFRVERFAAELEDVKMRWDDSKHEGSLKLWLQNPDNYRFEMRTQPSAPDSTTKLLMGSQMWVMTKAGPRAPTKTQSMHKSAEGAHAISQARSDRDRLSRLSHFLTLAGLMGPTVRFVYRGHVHAKDGVFAGKWLQVDRSAADGSLMKFFFAYDLNAKGEVARATFPGVVTIVGSAKQGTKTEHFLLSNWLPRPRSRYPGRIAAYLQDGAGPAKQVLLAFPRTIRINEPMPKWVFQKPR